MSFKRVFVLVAVSSLLLNACGSDTTNDASGPAAFGDRSASGESLANGWFELLSLTGSSSETVEVTAEDAAAGAALVKPFLDPAFQLQRATGQRYTRNNYIPPDIDGFEISNVFVTEPRDDIKVLRYATRTPGATVPDSSMVMSNDLAPRLTVVRWDEEAGRWLIVSHANFNTPIQAVCNQETIKLDSEEVATSNEDRELGEKLARTWFDLLIAGDGSPLLHPEAQGQTAAGTGYSTSAEYVKGQMKSAELSDFVVTRDGDLIIVTLGVDTEGTVFAGSTKLGAQKNARLLTFLQDDQGEWRLIATATFNPPAEVPAEVECAAA